jgi:CDGSH-type Zn-finger protein
MPRLVEKTAHKPAIVEGKAICMCGLSANQPFCDSSHLKTTDEDESKLYVYSKVGREEVITAEDGEGGCCGGGCCGNCESEEQESKPKAKK